MPVTIDRNLCPTCEGSREDECPHCGQDMECEDCDGTGFNSELFDLDAWQTKRNEFIRTHRKYCDLIVKGSLCGIQSKDGTAQLSIREFAYDLEAEYIVDSDDVISAIGDSITMGDLCRSLNVFGSDYRYLAGQIEDMVLDGRIGQLGEASICPSTILTKGMR